MRLDRFLATDQWLESFPSSIALYLKPSLSDHLPILMEVRARCPKKKRKNKRFRFKEVWLRDDECQRLVETGRAVSMGADPCSIISSRIEAHVISFWSGVRPILGG